AEAEDEAAVAEAGKRGGRLCEHSRAAGEDVDDAGHEPEPLGVLRRDGERREAVELRRLSRPDALVAERLDPADERRQLVQRDARERDRDPDPHATIFARWRAPPLARAPLGSTDDGEPPGRSPRGQSANRRSRTSVPVPEPAQGEVLVRTRRLSLDAHAPAG